MNTTTPFSVHEETSPVESNNERYENGFIRANLNREAIDFLNKQIGSMRTIGEPDYNGTIFPLTPILIVTHHRFVEIVMKESIIKNGSVKYYNTPACTMYILSDDLRKKLFGLSFAEEDKKLNKVVETNKSIETQCLAGGDYIHPLTNPRGLSKNR